MFFHHQRYILCHLSISSVVHVLLLPLLCCVKHRVILECTMMTSSKGNIFRVTGRSCGEFTGHRWIPRTKASDAELDRWIPRTKGQWRGALMFSLICAWINSWVNNREAGDLRRHHTHYDVTVMLQQNPISAGRYKIEDRLKLEVKEAVLLLLRYAPLSWDWLVMFGIVIPGHEQYPISRDAAKEKTSNDI